MLFKRKYTKWQSYLATRPNHYYDITPSPDVRINRSFSQMNAQTYYRQYNESVSIIKTTKKPEIFFDRYDFAVTRLIALIYMKQYVKIEGSNLQEAAEILINNKQEYVHQLIDRCVNALYEKLLKLKTNKSKNNNINAFEEQFMPYYAEISPENQDYIHRLADFYRQHINQGHNSTEIPNRNTPQSVPQSQNYIYQYNPNQKDLKQCPNCKQWIDKKVRICPYCQRTQTNGCLTIIGIIIIILLLSSACHALTTYTPEADSTPDVSYSEEETPNADN